MDKNGKLSDEKIEKILAGAKGSLAVEGLIVTDEEEKLVRKYLKGKLTEKEVLKIIKDT